MKKADSYILDGIKVKEVKDNGTWGCLDCVFMKDGCKLEEPKPSKCVTERLHYEESNE
jgi:hypothetical protein